MREALLAEVREELNVGAFEAVFGVDEYEGSAELFSIFEHFHDFFAPGFAAAAAVARHIHYHAAASREAFPGCFFFAFQRRLAGW